MKSKFHLLAIAAATCPTLAFAQSSSNYTAAPAIFVLTETHTAPALQEKDETGKPVKGGDSVYENEYTVESSAKSVSTYEYGSKMAVSKISNKEILQALVDAGAIPSITGWSIVIINGGESAPRFAANNGTQYIYLDDYMWIDSKDASAEASVYKKDTITITKNGETLETEVETGADKGKDLVEIGFDIDNTEVNLIGVAQWANVLKTVGKGADATTQRVDLPVKISGISGSLNSPESDGASVVEGLISTGASKPYSIE